MDASPYRVSDCVAVDDAEWEQLLSADSRSLPFHHPRWSRRFPAHGLGTAARFLEARDARGRLAAGLPYVERSRLGLRALVSGAGGTYGGPVCRSDASEAEAALLRAFATMGGARVMRRELVWGQEALPCGGGGLLAPIDTAVVDLEGGFDVFWLERFPMNRRNECNRSERRGATVEVTRSGHDLEGFHPMYRERSAQWGVGAMPLALLREALEQEDSARLIVVRRESELLGLHLCFECGDELFAWIGTTARSKEVFPASLIVKGEARYASERGLRRINLGSSLGLQGVASFKKLAGARASRRWILRREGRLLHLLRRQRGAT